jgi:hypothetical protein
MGENKKYDKQYHVASKSFPGKNLFVVSAKIEYKKFYSDAVFLEFTENFSEGNNEKTVMLVTANDLRALSYGIRELMKNGKSNFKKYTDPARAGGEGAKNELNIGLLNEAGKTTYYLNYSSGSKKIGCGFDPYLFVALSDTLLLIAEECDKALFFYQRSLYK